jgi:hypothetical protein
VIPAKKGINRFAWDFRGETLLAIPNAFVYGDYSGHRRAPGKYKARLTFKDAVAEAEIDLRQDPNLKNISAQDWAAQQTLLENAAKSLTEIHQSVIDMRKVKSQIEHHNALLKDNEEAKALYQAGQDLIQKLVDWEAKLVETRQKSFQDVINFPSQLNAQYFDLRAAVDVHDPRLTAGAKQRLQDLDKEWAGYKTAMNQLIEKDIVEYNQKFKAQNLPAVIMK